jgi:DNA-binding transcriptional regulator GbsR (MarR family)
MDKAQRRFEEKHFIEDVGLLFEQGGHPRMAGRILGSLLIADPPHQSMTELAETLQASKGSLSTMTHLLLQMGLIERVGLPGRRRDYFQANARAWIQWVQQFTFELSAMHRLVERGLELLEGENTDVRERLSEACDLFAFLEQEYPALIERWEKERSSSSRKKK